MLIILSVYIIFRQDIDVFVSEEDLGLLKDIFFEEESVDYIIMKIPSLSQLWIWEI